MNSIFKNNHVVEIWDVLIPIMAAIVKAVAGIMLPRYISKKTDNKLLDYWRYRVFGRRDFKGRIEDETYRFKQPV